MTVMAGIWVIIIMIVGVNMASQGKINRIFRNAGVLPQAARSIAETLNRRPEIFDNLTVKQVVMVIGLLNAHYHKGRADAEAAIIAEGAIWNPSESKLMELVPYDTSPGITGDKGVAA